MSQPIKNRYEFILLFDVKNGNPNGDPDAGNMPRIDPETGHGITTDVCIKRKIRNYVDLVKGNTSPFEIHVREGAFLSEHHKRAHKALDDGDRLFIHVPLDLWEEFTTYGEYPEGIGFENDGIYFQFSADLEKTKKAVGKLKNISAAAKAILKELFVESKEAAAKKWMCKNFYDVRTFGAVMSTGDKRCGQVRGPVQLGFSQSIDPIIGLDIAMSRTAAVNVDKPEDKGLGARKSIIPYGLYRMHGFVSAPFAKLTGFCDEDLDLFWNTLQNMFDHDRSAARGEMASQKLIVFKHDNELGNAPAHNLFDLVTVQRKDSSRPARIFTDYEVTIDETNIPHGVALMEFI